MATRQYTASGIRLRVAAACITSAVAAGLVVVSPATPAGSVPVIDCVSSDNGDPVLSSVTVSPATVDVTAGPQRVHVAAVADDTGGPGPAAGLRSLRVGIEGPRDSYKAVTMVSSGSGNWVGAFTMRKWAPAGTWRISQVILVDRVGQEISFGGENGRDLSTVPGEHAFAVISVDDPTPPQLTAFRFGPTTVDTTHRPRYVRFTARGIDAETGISLIGAVAVAPYEDAFAWTRLRRVKDHPHTFRGRALVHRFTSSGRWTVYAFLVNRTGRVRAYGPRALSRLGAASALRVRSRVDRSPPVLASFRRHPAVVDVQTSKASVTVTVRARDAGSGVRHVYASFGGVDAYADLNMHLVSGTRHDGVWQGTATIAQCPSESGTWRAWVAVEDRERIVNYSANQLRQHGWPSSLTVTARPDTSPPIARLVRQRVPTAGPVVVKFSEAVNGINAASAQVTDIDFESDVGPIVSGPPIDGEWTCTNRSGATINCGTGRVRGAAFTPTIPFPIEPYFRVLLNPEHNLDVTDLAGNPCDRDELFFTTTTTTSAPRPPGSLARRGYSRHGCQAARFGIRPTPTMSARALIHGPGWTQPRMHRWIQHRLQR